MVKIFLLEKEGIDVMNEENTSDQLLLSKGQHPAQKETVCNTSLDAS